MPVAIIGMHRSGTSLLARALNLCGLHLGDETDMVPAHASNEKGHWEHREFVRLDESVLAHFGVTWKSPPVFPPDWLEHPQIRSLLTEATAFVETTFAGKEPWGWKDPRVTAILPFWRQVMPNLRFVVCLRNPLDVAASLTARDHMPKRVALSLWQYYTELALRHAERDRRIVVHYEDFLTDYRSALAPVLAFLGLPALQPGSEQDREVAEFIEVGLSHHRHTLDEVTHDPEVPVATRLLYGGLRRYLPETLAAFDVPVPDAAATQSRSALDFELTSHLRARVAEVDRHATEVEAEYRRVEEHARRAQAAYQVFATQNPPAALVHQPVAPIYLSCSPRDRAIAEPFAAHLRSMLGSNDPRQVYVDACSYRDASAVQLQQVWQQRAEHEIAARPMLILLLTPHAVSDEIARAELRHAAQLAATDPNRRIVGVLLESCDLHELAADLEQATIVDFVRERFADAMRALLETIRTMSAPEPAATPTAERHEISVLTQQSTAAMRAGDWESALAQTRHALTLPGAADDAPLAANLALAFAGIRQWEPARATALRALALDPFRSDVWRALGQAYSALDQPADALDAYDHARALTPLTDGDARMALLAERYAQELRLKLVTLVAGNNRPAAEGDIAGWLTQRLDHLINLGHFDDALSIARELTARPEAGLPEWATYARLARMRSADSAVLRSALNEVITRASDDPGVTEMCRQLVEPDSAAGALPQRMLDLGFELRTTQGTEFVRPPVCEVGAGQFMMGSDLSSDPDAYPDEQPVHTVPLADFAIGRFPVTVAEYARFIQAGYRTPHDWEWQLCHLDQPVAHVSWRDARAYAAWLTGHTGELWHLPTEAEWEKSARWDPIEERARRYPWGDVFAARHCNYVGTGLRLVTPVGRYPLGASSYGAHDMAGNVWEWTDTVYGPYARLPSAVDAIMERPMNRVLRGGSARDVPRLARGACRTHRVPISLGVVVGFRLARGPQEA